MADLALRADCASCFGLCCVVPAFSASADFAIDKDAEEPCPHLQRDNRCGIHDRLRPAGFRGCAVFDCFGAGQHVSQDVFAGQDWRDAPESAGDMFAVFAVVRQLHELLWYVVAAQELQPGAPLDEALAAAAEETEQLSRSGRDPLLELDVAAHRRKVNEWLVRTSTAVRGDAGRQPGKDRGGADLVGADLRGADLSSTSLRGASLVGSDLRGADLRAADLTGADLRGANLGGTDLSGCLFLTQAQLDAATGDGATTVPARLRRPAHWEPSA
jgi:hypothetical protein